MISNVDIDQYNSLESNAKLFLPNRVIQAFSPFTFEKVGYPTRITDYRELWRFHDVMQENRFQGWLRNYFPNGMSTKEFDMFGKSINITNEYGKLLAADVQPRRLSAGENSLITSLYNWRNIHALLSLNNKEFRGNTFEVGPGNGYLSLLLAMSGYRVTALENTQAFYLYQKGLFQFTKEKIGNATYEKPKHICWWEFPSLAADAFVDADIVIANHMLNEMHPWALRFLLSKISIAWKDLQDRDVRFVYAEHLGGGEMSETQLIEIFSTFGFSGVRFGSLTFWTLSLQSEASNQMTKLVNHLKTQSTTVTHGDINRFINEIGTTIVPDGIFWNDIRVSH